MKKLLVKLQFKLASWLYNQGIIAPQLLTKEDGSDVKNIKILTDDELKIESFKNELLSCLLKNNLTKETHPYIIKGVNKPYKTKNGGVEPNIYYHHFIDLYFCKYPSTKVDESRNPEEWVYFNIGHFISLSIEHILTNSEYEYSYFDITELLWWFEDYLKENYEFLIDKVLLDGHLLSNSFKVNLQSGTYLIKGDDKDYCLTKEREDEINLLEIKKEHKDFFKTIFNEPAPKSSDLLVELVGQNPFLKIKNVKNNDTGEDITEKFIDKDVDGINTLFTLTNNLEWLKK